MKLPNDPKDVKAMREFFTQQRTAVCGLADCLEEPWRTHFQGLKDDYDQVLKDLGPSDQAPAAIEANKHLQAFASALASANALCAMLGAHVDSMRRNQATGFNSAFDAALKERVTKGELILATELPSRIEAAVTAELKKRTEAGELVPKETLTSLCSQAKETGLKEGRAALEAELKAKAERDARIASRKEVLATAGLPIPEQQIEALLGGSDEEFNTAKAEAESRVNGLKGKGVALNSKNPVWAKVWLPKEQWEAFAALVAEIPALKSEGPEPLAGAGRPSNVVPMGLY